jgi:hypothetical protein
MNEGALLLSRRLFAEIALPDLRRKFPLWSGRVAAGLVGNGSECFGYDDALSRDHDWGAEFYVWLTPDDYASFGQELEAWRQSLIRTQKDFPVHERSAYGASVGVMTIDDFYLGLTGCPVGPEEISEWRAVPEENLAMVVNGEVFYDPSGVFSAIVPVYAGVTLRICG